MKVINKKKGFTLIELVVVIVILGILAATAAPKFIDLQDDAQTATLQAVEASMQSASTLVYSKSLIKGNQATAAADDVDVVINGNDFDINFGYPLTDYTSETGAWTDIIELDSAFTSAVIDDAYVVYPANGTVPTQVPDDPDNLVAGDSTCLTFYQEASGLNATPTIATIPCT